MIGSFLERPFLIRMVFFFSFTVTVPLLALVCVSETDGSDGADEEEGDVEAEPDGAADDEAAGQVILPGYVILPGGVMLPDRGRKLAEGTGAAESV